MLRSRNLFAPPVALKHPVDRERCHWLAHVRLASSLDLRHLEHSPTRCSLGHDGRQYLRFLLGAQVLAVLPTASPQIEDRLAFLRQSLILDAGP